MSARARAPLVGGQSLQIQWTAADDVRLEGMRIQASSNGGRLFHTIAESLPPTTRSIAWLLPASTGVVDVRVRAVAVDTLSQNTDDSDERPLQILP